MFDRLTLAAVGVGFLCSQFTYDAFAQHNVAIVLDASGSMSDRMKDGRTKIDAAKEALSKIVGELPQDAQVALWVFSHQRPAASGCDNIERMVPLGSGSSHRETILSRLKGIRESGSTLIASSIERAAEDLAGRPGHSRAVVLLSDGLETCTTSDPCATVKALAGADAKLIVHTIGLEVSSAAQYQPHCMATEGRSILRCQRHYRIDQCASRCGQARSTHSASRDASREGASPASKTRKNGSERPHCLDRLAISVSAQDQRVVT